MRLLLVLALALPMLALGRGVTVTTSGGSPLPTTYVAGNGQSQVVTCGNSNKVKIFNECTAYIAWAWNDAGTAPAFDYDFCPGGTGTVCQYSVKGGMGNNSTIYIRSDSGSPVTSGCKVRVSCINEEAP